VPPAKKALKALKLMLVTLRPSAAPPAGSTRSISNARAHLCTASITPKASAVNKHRKLSTSPSLGLPKPSQRAKLIKVINLYKAACKLQLVYIVLE